MKPRFTLRPMAFALGATTVLGIDLESVAALAAGEGKSFSGVLAGQAARRLPLRVQAQDFHKV
jgi:hypothetical protein